jgi:hypothetical protein
MKAEDISYQHAVLFNWLKQAYESGSAVNCSNAIYLVADWTRLCRARTAESQFYIGMCTYTASAVRM